MAPRLGSGALYGASEAHAIEESLAAQLDADVVALEAADHLARLEGRAIGEDQAVELRDVERERALERAQRSEVHRHDAAAPQRACGAHRAAVGDVEAEPLVGETFMRAADPGAALRELFAGP